MSDFNPADLIHTVERIREKVLRSRYDCVTEFARDMHYRLLVKLDEMIPALVAEVEILRRFEAARATSREADIDYAIYRICTSFEDRWIESGPISLLDPIFIWVAAEGEGEVCRVGVDYTVVPDNALEGLAEIIAQLASETGVRFVVAHVPEQ